MTGQKKLSLHLDFVMKHFAQERSALMSLSIDTVLRVLKEYFHGFELDLSLHLMGETEDLYNSLKSVELYELVDGWQYSLYVPEKYYSNWKSLHLNQAYMAGIWYDLDEWKQAEFHNGSRYLIMTVFAGRSGQKADDKDKNKILEIAKKHPEIDFIVDGGWKIEEDPTMENVRMVSYSSFWSQFGDSGK